MQVAYSPDQLAAIVKPVVVRGTTRDTIKGIAALADAGAGDLSFLGNAKYKPQVASTRASVVLIPRDYAGEPRAGQMFMVVDNPSAALALVCARIEQSLWPKPVPGVHPTASVAPGARIDPAATVGPLCVVEEGAAVGAGSHLQAQVFLGRGSGVGADCWLMPGSVVAAACTLGDRVQLQPGAVVGSDGFGYDTVGGRHLKAPQIGTVEIGDDVEIGANTTLDRARFSRTAVGEGTKIDNLVQVGHNVIIGRHCLIVAQVGISGSTTLEDYVVLGGQAGLVGHITLGRGANVGAKSGVNRDLEPGETVHGNPCLPYMLERRITVLTRRLPDLFKRVDTIETLLAEGKKLA